MSEVTGVRPIPGVLSLAQRLQVREQVRAMVRDAFAAAALGTSPDEFLDERCPVISAQAPAKLVIGSWEYEILFPPDQQVKVQAHEPGRGGDGMALTTDEFLRHVATIDLSPQGVVDNVRDALDLLGTPVVETLAPMPSGSGESTSWAEVSRMARWYKLLRSRVYWSLSEDGAVILAVTAVSDATDPFGEVLAEAVPFLTPKQRAALSGTKAGLGSVDWASATDRFAEWLHSHGIPTGATVLKDPDEAPGAISVSPPSHGDA